MNRQENGSKLFSIEKKTTLRYSNVQALFEDPAVRHRSLADRESSPVKDFYPIYRFARYLRSKLRGMLSLLRFKIMGPIDVGF